MSINKFLVDVPNLAGKILVVSVGQGGCNFGFEFQKLGYTTFYVNTSKRDLDTIEAEEEYKYHIAGATGCNKNRNRAKKYVKNCYKRIVKDILDRFGYFTHILFTYTMGGGSGSAIAPMLMKAFQVIAPEKILGSLAVVPHENESPQLRANSVGCYSDLTKITTLCNMFWVRNIDPSSSREEMYQFNAEVISTVNDIYNMSTSDKGGNIDEQEVIDLLMIQGTVAIGYVQKKNKAKNPNNRFVLDERFISEKSQAKSIAYSLVDEDDKIEEELNEKYGEQHNPPYGFKDKGKSFAVVFGLTMPKDTFEKYKDDYEEFKDELKENESEIFQDAIEIEMIDDGLTKRKKQIEVENSLDTIFDELF